MKIVSTIRDEVVKIVQDKSKNIVKDRLKLLPVAALLELLSEIQKSTNSDYKMTLLSQELFKKELEGLEMLAENAKSMTQSLTDVTDVMCRTSFQPGASGKRNIAELIKTIMSTISTKSSGKEDSDDDDTNGVT